MALEVEIEKRHGGFTLEAAFRTDGAPLGLLGASGAGKTRALRAIAGLEAPDRGRIVLDGRVLFDSAAGINLPSRARRIGLLFQHYALFPHLSAGENIAFGLRHLAPRERKRRVAEQLAAAHLSDFAARYPASLSGGEQQRVALARALAIEPAALLLDEPFSALDSHLRSALERELRERLGNFRGATVFVSHNLEEVYRVCGELVVLSRGKVAARGPKEEIFRHPPTLEVARLTGCKNFSRARRAADGRVEAPDWGCALRAANVPAWTPRHIAIRAHHVRVGAAGPAAALPAENSLPCWLAAMTETPFRVTLDLHLGGPASNARDFHVQAEVYKQEWETFRDAPQPWLAQLPPDRLILLPD